MRKRYLDIARGSAIILVIMGHLLAEGGIRFTYSYEIHKMIYGFHMPAFFLISGIGVGYSLRKKENVERPQIHLKQLIRKTIILYCAWSAIYFAISGVSSRAEIKEWIECIVTLRGRAPIWYLSALALAEIVFLVVLYVADKWRFSRNGTIEKSL